MPRAALVIPHRREERLISALLASIDRLVANDRRVLVYLVGSEDDSPGYKSRVARLVSNLDPLRVRSMVASRGIGSARDVGCRRAIQDHRDGDLRFLWLINSDADCQVTPQFVDDWLEALATSWAPVGVGEVELVGTREEGLARVVRQMMRRQDAFEEFAGPINTFGQNLAIRADTYLAVGGFSNPTAIQRGRIVPMAGEDWEFGARCRSRGVPIARIGPRVEASARRLRLDPSGFVSGLSYQGEFRSVSELAPTKRVRGGERVLRRELIHQRFHFLVKPIVLDEPFRRWLAPQLSFGERLCRWWAEQPSSTDQQLSVALGVRWGAKLEEEAVSRSNDAFYRNYVQGWRSSRRLA